ncbi:hypothetical protein BLNAU_20583 [Blattamonas nauphoetae]|uniref:Uncharacterized protein n=1 Tax=Blattamonas nauphoetae TaxID=2049346 RepID=A0ABQ9X1I9_9EUKA|nr:hypothetical protein BLNAU_20583 [Blattamonas nauphoetae]
MFEPIGDDDDDEDDDVQFERYPLIRVSVFEPVKEFITFIFHNSGKLILNENDKTLLENQLCWMRHHINNMELRSDEHDADIVSELVKWEIQQMVEMENEEDLKSIIFSSMLNRTYEWKRDKPERLKRREVVLRKEGWDDAFELRVVKMDADTDLERKLIIEVMRALQALNVDEF